MTKRNFRYRSAAEFHAVWGDTDPCYNKLIGWKEHGGDDPAVVIEVYQPRLEVTAVIRVAGALDPMTLDWLTDMASWSN